MAAPTLEDMITEVTSPLTTHIDLHAFKKIYDHIKTHPGGPESALRLLAHKVQSPQEKEAMNALVILDLCVQNCGEQFHAELARFKFLNEIIKVLSPKYLGESTPKDVFDKCVVMMFTWQRDLGEKYPKIREAYQMLKKQNVIMTDPVSANESENAQYTERMANRSDLFKKSRHSETLEKLMKSRNPEDLRLANALIKSIVNEEDNRIMQRSQLTCEVETLKSNTNVFEEILNNLGPGEPTASELELMQSFAGVIKLTRPNIFKLALTDADTEEGLIATVIETCSRASSMVERYEVLVLHKPPSTVSDPATLPPPAAASAVPTDAQLDLLLPEPQQDLLTQDLLLLGIGDESSQAPAHSTGPPIPQHNSNVDLLSGLLSRSTPPTSPVVASVTPGGVLAETTALSLPCCKSPKINTDEQRQSLASAAASVFGDLDMAGRQLLGFGGSCSSNASLDSPAKEQQSVNGLTAPPTPPAPPSTTSLPRLSALPELPLSAIKPYANRTDPLIIYPCKEGGKTGTVEVAIHFTANRPHPSVIVFVAIITNKNALPVSDLCLRLGVDKPLKLRQLPPSATSLPAFCSFLPPSPAQQIIFIQRPSTPNIFLGQLKFQLSFTLNDDEEILESGTTTLPLPE